MYVCKSNKSWKSFQGNYRLFFRKNWTCRNRNTKTTHTSQFWVVHNNLFASCLPINQENQTPKTDHSLHHDNASSQTSAQTTAFLTTQNTDLMSHPLYSPELARNDFFLLSYVKNKMRAHRFSTPEETVDAFRMHVLELPQSGWQKCFDN